MERYLEVSREVMDILAAYTPHMQQISVDEAFLDLTGTERLFGPARGTGARLKTEVRRKTGLAISVGIGPNKYLAKLATNAGKPDGLVEVRAEEAEAFLDGVALKDLWGIGEKTLQRLTELNITSVRQLRGIPQPELSRLLGQGSLRVPGLGRAGIRTRASSPRSRAAGPCPARRHSSATGRTGRASSGYCWSCAHQVMFRMIEDGWKSKTVALKLRFHDFTTVSAQKTLKHWVSSAEELYAVAVELLSSRWTGRHADPAGRDRASRTSPPSRRRISWSFSRTSSRAAEKVEEAVFRLRRRWETCTLTKASLMKEASSAEKPPTSP